LRMRKIAALRAEDGSGLAFIWENIPKFLHRRQSKT
jgi:hypothetical protein